MGKHIWRIYIYLNNYYLKNFDSQSRTHVVLHEFGHALGLGHNKKGDVIFNTATGKGDTITLSENDKASCDAAYYN